MNVSFVYIYLLFDYLVIRLLFGNSSFYDDIFYGSYEDKNISILSPSEWGGDDAQRVQKIIDEFGRKGGKLILRKGKYNWASTPGLPANLSGNLTIVGNGSTIVLSKRSRVFDLRVTGTPSVFKNYILRDFRVDARALAGKSHVLVGSRVDGGFQGAFSAENWLLEDIEVMNIRNDPTSENQLVGVMLTPFLAEVNNSCFLKNITFKNVSIHGGNGGFQINAFSRNSNGANCYLNAITLKNCSHIISGNPKSHYSCSNIHIGGFGFGDSCKIENFRGTGSGDNGIEINAMQNVEIKDANISNAFEYSVYLQNYHPSIDVSKQKVEIKDSRFDLSNVANGRAISWGSNSFISNRLGKILISNISVFCNRISNTNGLVIQAAPNGPGTIPIDSLVINNLTFLGNLGNYRIEKPTYFSLFTFSGTGRQKILMKDIKIKFAGSLTNLEQKFYPRLFEFTSSNACFDIANLEVNYNIRGGEFWLCFFKPGIGRNLYNFSNISIKSDSSLTTIFRISRSKDNLHKHIISTSGDQIRMPIHGRLYYFEGN